MNNGDQKLSQPRPEDFGLEAGDAPVEGFETIKLGGLGIPKRLSPAWNWILGLSAAVPLALWSLWGLITKLDSLVLGVSIGVLAAIVVFQLAVSVAPMIVDVLLYGAAFLIDEISSTFNEKARHKLEYRKAWRAYRTELARGGYDRER
jgi:hypothetical protein